MCSSQRRDSEGRRVLPVYVSLCCEPRVLIRVPAISENPPSSSSWLATQRSSSLLCSCPAPQLSCRTYRTGKRPASFMLLARSGSVVSRSVMRTARPYDTLRPVCFPFFHAVQIIVPVSSICTVSALKDWLLQQTVLVLDCDQPADCAGGLVHQAAGFAEILVLGKLGDLGVEHIVDGPIVV